MPAVQSLGESGHITSSFSVLSFCGQQHSGVMSTGSTVALALVLGLMPHEKLSYALR
jgi:hypothetical protein